ncbi:MAG: hypothetical protein AB1304_10700 [Bacteroidota bacterium]
MLTSLFYSRYLFNSTEVHFNVVQKEGAALKTQAPLPLNYTKSIHTFPLTQNENKEFCFLMFALQQRSGFAASLIRMIYVTGIPTLPPSVLPCVFLSIYFMSIKYPNLFVSNIDVLFLSNILNLISSNSFYFIYSKVYGPYFEFTII